MNVFHFSEKVCHKVLGFPAIKLPRQVLKGMVELKGLVFDCAGLITLLRFYASAEGVFQLGIARPADETTAFMYHTFEVKTTVGYNNISLPDEIVVLTGDYLVVAGDDIPVSYASFDDVGVLPSELILAVFHEVTNISTGDIITLSKTAKQTYITISLQVLQNTSINGEF